MPVVSKNTPSTVNTVYSIYTKCTYVETVAHKQPNIHSGTASHE